MQIPLFTISGSLLTNPAARITIEVPIATFRIEAGGAIDFSGIMASMFVSGSQSAIATIEISSPRQEFTISAIKDGSGCISINNPASSLFLSGKYSDIVPITIGSPIAEISMSGLAGHIASIDINTPAPDVLATSYWLSGGEIEIAIPMAYLFSSVLSSYVGLSLNTKNFRLSSYSSFNYNSLVTLNNKNIGISKTGIYELSGNDDDGAKIDWKVKSGLIDLLHSHMRYAWLSGKILNDVKLLIELPDGTGHEYQGEPAMEEDSELRIKIGKGIKTRYSAIKLSGYGPVEIDNMRIFGVNNTRKR